MGLMVDRPSQVSLTDAVQAVRSELLAAVTDLASEEVRFALGSVELEFAIELQLAVDGKVQVLVLPAGASLGGSAAAVRLHRLTVTLDPVDTSGQSVKIRRGLGDDEPGD
jgi:hypothetical protein